MIPYKSCVIDPPLSPSLPISGAMLNIVQDSALLESIGAQTETVRLFIYSTVCYDAKGRDIN